MWIPIRHNNREMRYLLVFYNILSHLPKVQKRRGRSYIPKRVNRQSKMLALMGKNSNFLSNGLRSEPFLTKFEIILFVSSVDLVSNVHLFEQQSTRYEIDWSDPSSLWQGNNIPVDLYPASEKIDSSCRRNDLQIINYKSGKMNWSY